MGKPAYVYNPDDEEDVQRYQAVDFTLRPNGTTGFLDHDSEPQDHHHVSPWKDISGARIAIFVAEKLAQWGGALVAGPEASEDEVVAAERQYLVGTLAWARAVLRDHLLETKDDAEGGMPANPAPEDVKRARAWLAKYDGKLREAALIE